MSIQRYDVISYDPTLGRWQEAKKLSHALVPSETGMVVMWDDVDHQKTLSQLEQQNQLIRNAINELEHHAVTADIHRQHGTANLCQYVSKLLSGGQP